MIRFNIESENLEFKNLLSGPAPIGRMLNYLYKSGTDQLFHKNGYRSLDFNGNIGSAWATEFMIGLGMVYIGPEITNKNFLLLTAQGEKLFNDLKENYSPFEEGTTSNDIKLVLKQINKNNPKLYDDLFELFLKSMPFRILKEYLNENGYYYNSKDTFMDDLFEDTKNAYDKDGTPYNRNARTPTSRNRVPSLLQMCELFDMVDLSNSDLKFNSKKINSSISDFYIYTEQELQQAEKQEKLILKNINELVEKYGLDGNVLRESIVRNSSLQSMFKNNLMISQEKKCVMCGIEIEELLVGSHIIPAAQSDVVGKVDYNNGLLLCCNHDKLFDKYLITFNFIDGQIQISKLISDNDKVKLNLDDNFKLDPKLLTEQRKEYLMEHNLEFMNREVSR